MSNPETILTLADPFDDARLRDLVDAIHGANGDIAFRDAIHGLFDPWVKGARQMAVELTKSVEGTHVFDMIAEMEKHNVNTTETLIHMVAATVLAKLIHDEGGGRANIAFSPADMDAMHRDYEMSATRDGLLTVVSIKPRPESVAGLFTQEEDVTDAKPQAVPTVAKPYWFYNDGAERHGPMSRRSAEAEMRVSTAHAPFIENRMCSKVDCKNSDAQGNCPVCSVI